MGYYCLLEPSDATGLKFSPTLPWLTRTLGLRDLFFMVKDKNMVWIIVYNYKECLMYIGIGYDIWHVIPNPDKPEITNHKHQISNKFQITSSKFQILKNQPLLILPALMKISFSIRLPFFKIIYYLFFGILSVDICLSFEICCLEFLLTQLLHKSIQKSLLR